MSSAVFPSLIGITWDILRTPNWNTIKQSNASGKQTNIKLWPYPKWQWQPKFNYLGSGALNGQTNTDLQTLAGFFNSRNGSFDSFLYTEPTDYSVTGQAIGTGDGTTLTFQLFRTFGGFVEQVLAPNVVSKVYVDGVDKTAFVTVSPWGLTTPGLLTFSAGHAPAAGKAVTADFTYYWPVGFDDDSVDFNNVMGNIWELQKLSFTQRFNY